MPPLNAATSAPDDKEGIIVRDRWGRPLLVPAGGDATNSLAEPDAAGRVPYTRASSLADYASGVKTGLEVWKRRLVARGVAEREDIAGMIAALPPLGEGKQYASANKATNELLDGYMEQALDHAGGNHGADRGTAIHAFTTREGGLFPPERMKADIEAFRAEVARRGWMILDEEAFVACDALWTAGTFDCLIDIGDRIVVGDKKTGKPHHDDACVQLSIYSHSDLYLVDGEGVQRTALAHYVESTYHKPFDPDLGIYIHINDGCTMTGLDLSYGFQVAKLAADVRNARLGKNKEHFYSEIPEKVEASAEAEDEDELTSAKALQVIFGIEDRNALQEYMATIPKDTSGMEKIVRAANARWAELA